MPTLSEQLVSKISEKFFFPRYVYKNIFFQDENGEHELSDVIIEFVDFYVCIQVKEKATGSKNGDFKWFENKVLTKAIKQSKETIKSLAKNGIEFYTYSENGERTPLIINCEKAVLPVIIFYNSEYKTYNRHYFSKSINMPINIFSYEDFCVMLDTIIIPYDIVGYLLERSAYIPKHGGQRFIIEDLSEEITMLTKPQVEKDYAEMYLAKNYFNGNVREEYVKFYNELLSMLYARCVKDTPELFDLLICADTYTANRIVKNYCFNVEHIRSEEFNAPLFIHSHDSGIVFFRKPVNLSEEEYAIALERFAVYYAYKYKLTTIYILVYMNESDDKFSINPICVKLALPEYDEQLEEMKRFVEEYLK